MYLIIVSIGSIAPIRYVMYLRYLENPSTFVTTRELVDMEAVLDKSPLLLSSSNGNCLLNNKTGAPMIFAYSKFAANQNRS